MLEAQSPVDGTSRLRGDTLSRLATDSLPPTAVDSAIVDFSKVKISNDGVDDIVEYGAQDSMWFDVKNKRLHLYGQATVKYTTLNITAGYILLDYVKNEVSAESFPIPPALRRIFRNSKAPTRSSKPIACASISRLKKELFTKPVPNRKIYISWANGRNSSVRRIPPSATRFITPIRC